MRRISKSTRMKPYSEYLVHCDTDASDPSSTARSRIKEHSVSSTTATSAGPISAAPTCRRHHTWRQGDAVPFRIPLVWAPYARHPPLSHPNIFDFSSARLVMERYQKQNNPFRNCCISVLHVNDNSSFAMPCDWNECHQCHSSFKVIILITKNYTKPRTEKVTVLSTRTVRAAEHSPPPVYFQIWMDREPQHASNSIRRGAGLAHSSLLIGCEASFRAEKSSGCIEGVFVTSIVSRAVVRHDILLAF